MTDLDNSDIINTKGMLSNHQMHAVESSFNDGTALPTVATNIKPEIHTQHSDGSQQIYQTCNVQTLREGKFVYHKIKTLHPHESSFNKFTLSKARMKRTHLVHYRPHSAVLPVEPETTLFG
jgi:hypothetical protein